MNADHPRPINNEVDLTEAEKHKTLKKVVFSSFLGNFIEWFDYASYSYLATVIALVFFPGEDKMVSTMMTFGVFALAFLVRPIGAIFWGNMGDKKGRKWALSISILMMSGATFLIGCLPGYAVIGVGAPLLLLLMRMVQSFSASGEYAPRSSPSIRRRTTAVSTAPWFPPQRPLACWWALCSLPGCSIRSALRPTSW